MKQRITKGMSLIEIVTALAEGNPGAATTMMDAVNNGVKYDKTGACIEGLYLEHLFLLDKIGIYGTDIYVLYNDICERSLRSFIALLLASTFKDASYVELLRNISHRQDFSGKKMIDVDKVISEVREYYRCFV